MNSDGNSLMQTDIWKRRTKSPASNSSPNGGWDAFRAAETEILSNLLENKPTEAVISLGGGIVETESARDILQNYPGPVIHISRDIKEIVTLSHF